MYIDKSVMEEYLSDEKFDALCKQKGEIYDRYFEITEIIDDFKKQEITEAIQCGWGQGEGSGRESYKSAKKKYPNDAIKMWKLIGGYDKNEKPRDIFRIISASRQKKENLYENEKYSTIGIDQYSNSNFASNNSPRNIQKFLQVCISKKFDEAINESQIVLTWQSDSYLESSSYFDSSKKRLETRFPPKFLWMWANKDNVIHPLSLMAFREFLKSEFMLQVFANKRESLKAHLGDNINEYVKNITNSRFDDFVQVWETISKEILNRFQGLAKKKVSAEGSEKTLEPNQKISLLISLLTLGETDMTNIDELLKTHKQIILYGVPGTGKTHNAKELIRKWSKETFQVTQEESKKEDDLKNWQFGEIAKEKNGGDCVELDCEICKKIAEAPIVWDIMQFHPNTTYQDFIGGIIPKTQGGSLTYEVESGKFKKFCEYASANKDKKFVFIIDEINRANLSEVLGELLYALEYRDEGITIPNFKEPFVIPSNVYIIGTMNNVDKSLATFDLALRRRFGFYEVGVDCDVIGEILKSKGIGNLDAYIGRCQDLNALISGEIEEEDKDRLQNEEKLNLEKHYKIGQAYFAKIEKFLQKGEAINPNHLRKLWDYHLQPLIEEYIGFSMNDKEISNKLKRLKDFWTKKLPEESE